MMTTYPTIEKAIKEIAYDNGAIFRGQTEEFVVNRAMAAVKTKYSPETLAQVDLVLSEMTEDELQEFCCGERPDSHPYHLQAADEVLNEAFDNL